MDRTITEAVNRFVGPDGFEAHPFKVGWYNKLVDDPFKLEYHHDTLAIVVLSLPQMFEKTFLPFVYKEINRIVGPEPERTSEKTGRNVQEKKSNDNDDPRSEPEQDERTFTAFPSNKVLQDPMDQCMKHYFEKLKSKLVGNSENGLEGNKDIILMHDFDMNHKRRPIILMQTAGHVAGAAFYYRKKRKKNCKTGMKKVQGSKAMDDTKEYIQQNQLELKEGIEINNVERGRMKEEFVKLRNSSVFNQVEERGDEDGNEEGIHTKKCSLCQEKRMKEMVNEDSDLFHRRCHHHLQVHGNVRTERSVVDVGDRFDGSFKEDGVMSCGKGKEIESRNGKEVIHGKEERMMIKDEGENEKMQGKEEDEEEEEEGEGGYLTGVSIHPRFGGWFAFRTVLVFPTIQVEEGMVQVDPLDVLMSEEEKEALITSFIHDWKSAEYRNVIQPANVYSERQRRYFETKPKHRVPLLMAFYRENLTSREFVLGH